MYSFCTHGQNWHIKKALYKGLLMFIELFKFRNKMIIVNIFVNVLLQILLFCLSITSNIEVLSYVGSITVSSNIRLIKYFNTAYH